MHQSTREYLEEYLRDPAGPGIPQEFHTHVAACGECTQQLEKFQTQRRLLGGLRSGAAPEQSAGFYARVLSRLEEPVRESFWTPFLEPAFGRRLAYACATLVLLAGTYLVSSDDPLREHANSSSGVVPSMSAAAFGNSDSFEDGAVQPRQRDAVLVNLVTFQE